MPRVYVHFTIKSEWLYGEEFFIETAKSECLILFGKKTTFKNLKERKGFELGVSILKIAKLYKLLKQDHIRSMFKCEFAF
jgi:hypothetical protein